MSSNNSNPSSLLLEGSEFTTIDRISANEGSLDDILSCILKHEEIGVPLVVHGLNADPNWSPLPRPGPSGEHGDVEGQPPGMWMFPLKVNLV